MGVSKESDVPKVLFMFQSPQWGYNSKVVAIETQILEYMFQSPQWGVILKTTYITTNDVRKVSVPAMGKAF